MGWMRVVWSWCAVVGSLAVTGCMAAPGAEGYADSANGGLLAPGEAERTSAAPAAKPASRAASSDEKAAPPAADGGERMLIVRGAMTVEVARPEQAVADFLARVRGAGGHLGSQRGSTVTVRVPAAQFEATWDWLRQSGRVLDESREASDVTDQFVDLGIRIDNARKARERLLALLEKAQKVEDMLQIERELRRLTEEIERMEGQQKLLADQVAMSTLAATFATPASATPSARPAARRSAHAWIRSLGAESLFRRS